MNQTALIDLISKKVLEQVKNTKGGIPVGVSARHVHLSKEDLNKLFGEGYELTPIKELMGGQYAAKETVTIVGTKLRPIENVRVLGPIRPRTQVEVSKTDAVRLGLNPPVRESGKLDGSAPITIVGPKGAISLDNGCIVAMRHIHMSPEDAINYGVKDKQIVKVRVSSDRGGMLTNVLVRVHESYTLQMHIDTDEANALSIKCNDSVEIID
ncbi:MAG: phosphate propanoyltransferase [Vallitalea sp.]|jgi:putative phosphotransacetylase|nr:phosphate propanoyltransferase [Vallitalea sp.]